jgi:predicted phage replisome organizer
MAEYRKEKFYWLKLKRDFFKRHDIKVVESMDNGKEYILFYMKLLLESVDHNGNLRFNETIPYNEKMLATITDTNIDIVRNAMKIFTELKLIDIMDDSTIYMNEVNNMIGIQTYGAERKQLQRQNNNVNLLSGHKGDICPPDIDKEIELELEKDKEKDITTTNNELFNSSNSQDNDFMNRINNDTKVSGVFTDLERKLKWNFLQPKGRELTEFEARLLMEWIDNYPKLYLDYMISELSLINDDKKNFKYLRGAITKAYDKWLKQGDNNSHELDEIERTIRELEAQEKAKGGK